MKKIKSVLQILITMLLIYSCNSTTTKIKNPDFALDTKTLEGYLNEVVTCESFNVNGKEINTNGEKKSILEIGITNAKNIPTDDAKFKSLMKLVASIIKKGLKDQEQFDSYNVIVVSIKTKTNILGTTTSRTFKGFEFKSNELLNGS